MIVEKVQTTFGGDTAQKNVYWDEGHCTYFVDGGTFWVETPHNISKNRVPIGGDTTHRNWMICSYWVGDTAQNPYGR